MMRTLNLAKGFWIGKVKENSMITSIEKKEAERQAAENSRRKRYLMKYEIDGITALLLLLVKAYVAYVCFYLLKWDNAKRKILVMAEMTGLSITNVLLCCKINNL